MGCRPWVACVVKGEIPLPETISLSALPVGGRGCVLTVNAAPAMARRLEDLGLIPGTCVTCEARGARGGPGAYRIRGALIALRQSDAQGVTVTPQAVSP